MRRLRSDEGWLPALSLVAVAHEAVVGHVVCARGFVDDVPALGLGPISVLHEAQGGGVGHALMHAVLGAADATGEPVVVLLGAPAFYRRFGFAAASELGIVAPDAAWVAISGACAELFPARPHGHLPLRRALCRTLSDRRLCSRRGLCTPIRERVTLVHDAIAGRVACPS